MEKHRLDLELVRKGLVKTRSQAESYIRLGKVNINGKVVTKPGSPVSSQDKVHLNSETYVSRAGLKLASVAQTLGLSFADKVVLDVGSSTGGFTDFALRHGASKVIAVDVGTEQLHPSLRGDPRVELYDQTDIRNVELASHEKSRRVFIQKPDIILVDVSFISLREILPHVLKLMTSDSCVVAMAKPQFEAGVASKHKGVIKNDKMRRNTLKELENWIQKLFKLVAKADSEVHGEKGNRERFYLLRPLPKKVLDKAK